MKKWVNAEIDSIEISATASGKHDNKFEGIDGVDAHGEYNKYINKHGTGTFVPPSGSDDTDLPSGM